MGPLGAAVIFYQNDELFFSTVRVFISCRKVRPEPDPIQNLQLRVGARIHGPAEDARHAGKIRVLHELRGERRPDPARHLVPQQHQPQRKPKLLHH